MEKKYLLIIFALVFFFPVCAQNVSLTAGGNDVGAGGIVSYSVGQVFYTDKIGSTGTEHVGIQSPYELRSDIPTDMQGEGINLFISAFPNPATDFLVLNMGNIDIAVSSYSFTLYDMDGRVLNTNKIISTTTQIPMGNLAASTYLLKVSADDKIVHSFTILKK